MIRGRSISHIAVVSAILLAAVCVQATPPGTGWSQVWNDEFNDYSHGSDWRVLNESTAGTQTGERWMLTENVYENGSRLVIESHALTSAGSHGELFSGGRIDTSYKKYWNKGYFESSCRLDWADNHIWPTFWMWEWKPDTVITEFDIMEYTHWHPTPTLSHHYNGKVGTSTTESGTSVSSYHTWGLLWTASEVTFYVDGVSTFSSSNPTDAKDDFLPIIFSSAPNGYNLPAAGANLPRYFVDWVRVWQGGSVGGGSGAPIGQTIALRADANWQYAFADGAQTSWPLATRSTIGGWGKFAVIDAGGGYIALRADANWQYVTVDTADAKKLKANGSSIGSAQKFTWEVISGNQIALKSALNGEYVYADGGQSNWPLKTRAIIGGWGKFTWSQQ